MSLILEALRKSEAERRRGSTPNVAIELPPATLLRVNATPAWLLPAVTLGVFVLLAAWWWSQRGAGPHASVDAVVAVTVPSPRLDSPPPVILARPVQAPLVGTMPSDPVAPPPVAVATQRPAAAGYEPVPAPMRPPAAAPPATVGGPNVADIDATSLPPVKLSMHMWDASPDKRFVILDGQRMVEGERKGAMTVIAIERDGVVVERDGQRARVPLP